MSTGNAILWGGLVAGVLDLADALIFFNLRGTPPVRLLQFIASGLLGNNAFRRGWAAAALGVVLHFIIAFGAAGAYVGASRFLSALILHALPCGLAYGLMVYFFMNLVVLPLSAVDMRPFAWPVFINGILIHMLGIGLPIALLARS